MIGILWRKRIGKCKTARFALKKPHAPPQYLSIVGGFQGVAIQSVYSDAVFEDLNWHPDEKWIN